MRTSDDHDLTREIGYVVHAPCRVRREGLLCQREESSHEEKSANGVERWRGRERKGKEGKEERIGDILWAPRA